MISKLAKTYYAHTNDKSFKHDNRSFTVAETVRKEFPEFGFESGFQKLKREDGDGNYLYLFSKTDL